MILQMYPALPLALLFEALNLMAFMCLNQRNMPRGVLFPNTTTYLTEDVGGGSEVCSVVGKSVLAESEVMESEVVGSSVVAYDVPSVLSWRFTASGLWGPFANTIASPTINTTTAYTESHMSLCVGQKDRHLEVHK